MQLVKDNVLTDALVLAPPDPTKMAGSSNCAGCKSAPQMTLKEAMAREMPKRSPVCPGGYEVPADVAGASDDTQVQVALMLFQLKGITTPPDCQLANW